MKGTASVAILQVVLLLVFGLDGIVPAPAVGVPDTNIKCDFSQSDVIHVFTAGVPSSEPIISKGKITSQNWPRTYRPKSAACRVKIDQPEGYYLDFTFERLNLPECRSEFINSSSESLVENCGKYNGCDYVMLKENNTSPVFLHGDLSGKVYVTRGRSVQLAYCSSQAGNVGRKWRVFYTARKIRPEACYYSIILRHTCPDGSCADSQNDCDKKTDLYPKKRKGPTIPKGVAMGIVWTVLILIVVVIAAMLFSNFLRKVIKRLKGRLTGRADDRMDTGHVVYPDYDVDSDADSESSEELNSQGRDTLNPMSRRDILTVEYKDTCYFGIY